MGKHLVYLGSVGELHRVAHIDTDNLPHYRVRIKDTPILPSHGFLNCEVVKGKPVLSLKGSIPISTCIEQDKPQFKSYGNSRSVVDRELWVYKNKKPDWLYWTHFQVGRFYPGEIMPSNQTYMVWDGVCRDTNWYSIGLLLHKTTRNRHESTGSYFCINSEGLIGLFAMRDMCTLIKGGCRFILAGTPELTLGDRYKGGAPVVSYYDDREKEILWFGRRDKFMKAGDVSGFKSVWQIEESYGKAILDLRRYTSAEVIGPMVISDARAVILPETTKMFYASCVKRCPGLSAMYVPASCEYICSIGTPVRRIKNVTFYSNSEAVQRYASDVGASYVECSSSDEFLEAYYAPTDSEYIDAHAAASIASLADARSVQQGISGTVMSAILLSIESRGCDYEALNQRFPIVESMCVSLPEEMRKYAHSTAEIKATSQLGSELLRLQVAGFTQFFPKYETELDMPDDWNVIYLGDYEFRYMFKNTSKINDTVAIIVHRASQKIIHSFTFESMRVASLIANLETLVFFSSEPCGVLRYADKLGVMYGYYFNGSGERERIIDAVFSSFFPVSYGTRNGKSQLLGIDLHTGAFTTASTVTSGYIANGERAFKYGSYKHHKWFVNVGRASNIKLYPMTDRLESVLPRGCAYSKNGV